MASILSTIQQNFSPLKIPNFRLYLGGQAVSLIGTWLQVTAQGWLVWELSKSEAALGTVNMLASLPLLLLSPWAGVWADRLNRRRLLIATQTGAMLLAFILATLAQINQVQLWHVYVLSLTLGILTTLDFPTQQAFIGDLAGMSEVRRAVNLNATMLQVSRMIGPALAGLIFKAVGAATAFWLNGVSFLAVIISLVFVRSQQVKRPPTSNSVLREMYAGWQFLRQQSRLQDLLICAGLVTFFGLSVLGLMPAIAGEMFGGDAQTLGLLLSASGAGALVSTLLVAPIVQAQKRVGLMLGGALLWMATWLTVFSFLRWLPLALGCVFLFSLGAPLVLASALGLLQVLVPPEMRARLLSLFTMISFGLQPIAAVVVGQSAQHLGNPTTIMINGLAMGGGAVLLLLLRPDFRAWVLAPRAAPATAPASH